MGDLYNIIQTVCQEKGVKVSRMCLDIGLSKSIMSDLKAGRKKTLSVATLNKIADYLAVPVSILLNEEEDSLAAELQILRDRSDLRTLLDVTKGMTPEQVRKMIDMISIMKEG